MRGRILFGYAEYYLPIHFAFGPIQHLYTVLVWQTPVHAGLLGLARVASGIIYAHPSHLESNQVVWEKESGERKHFRSGEFSPSVWIINFKKSV